MSGPVPGIHVFLFLEMKTWMAGTSPAMTRRNWCDELARRAIFRFRRRANQNYKPRRPVPRRGVGHRHERWDGMRWTRQHGARWRSQGEMNLVSDRGVQDERCCNVRRSRVVLASVADAKFAEVLASSTGRDKTINLQTTVTKRNSSPGRARRKPLKPFACGNVG